MKTNQVTKFIDAQYTSILLHKHLTKTDQQVKDGGLNTKNRNLIKIGRAQVQRCSSIRIIWVLFTLPASMTPQ
jgi:hypothetical protein